jgi:hypothetical protein
VGGTVEDQPAKADVGLPETVHEFGEFVKHKLLSHDTLGEELLALTVALVLFQRELVGESLDTLDLQDVTQGMPGSFVGSPPVDKIDNVAQVERDYPSVIEVFIDNLSHDVLVLH